MIILYCEKCGKRVDEKDVTAGAARVDAQNHAICSSCAPPKRKDSHRIITPAVGAGKSPSTRIVQAPGKTVALPDSRGIKPQPSNMRLIGIGLTAACALLFVSVWYFGLRGQTEDTRTLRVSDSAATSTQKTQSGNESASSHDSGTKIVVPNPDDPNTSRSTGVTPPSAPDPSSGGETYDPRGMMANSLLIQAKDYYAKFPRAPWVYKEKLEDLVKRYNGTPASVEAGKIITAGNFPPRPPSKEADRLPDEAEWHKALELLPSADPGQDTIRNGWSWKGDFLVSSDHAWMTMPYMPSEEYDLRIVFTRHSGGESLGINLPRIDRACTFVLCSFGDVGHGFEMVQGRRACDLPGYTPRPGMIQNGKTYVLAIQVRRDVLKAWLNGQLLSSCQVTAEETMPFSDWDPKRLERLAIGCWGGCAYEIRSLKILEWAGEGAFLRPPPAKTVSDDVAFAPDTRGGETSSAGNPASPTTPSTPVAKPDDVTVRSPDPASTSATQAKPAEATPKAAYAAFLTELWLYLSNKNWAGAYRHVADAKANAKLASFKASLELDGELVNQAEAAEQAVEAGAQLLKDGRSFVLQQKDGKGVKKIALGPGGTATIDRIKGRVIDVNERIGGGKVGFSLPIDTLLPLTCQALAEMYLKDQPQGFLALAAGRFPVTAQPARDEDFNAWLKKAAQDAASESKARQLSAWLDVQKAEAEAKEAFAAVEALLESKDAEKTLAALDGFFAQHADTAFALESRKAAAKLREKAQALMREPGLWATYWSASRTKQFERMVFAHVEQVTYDGNIVEKVPDDKIPRYWFNLRYEGMLRVSQSGRYEFKLFADDRIGLWIDGKAIKDLSAGDEIKQVDLTAGDHTLRIEYANDEGGGFFVLKWKPPGAGDFSNIPAEHFWHRKGQEVGP
jgi:hypothetical protein